MSKAEEILAPTGDGTNVTTVTVFTLTTTPNIAALPRGYYGNYIRIIGVGAGTFWFLTKNGSAAILAASSNTGSAAGATAATAGSYLPAATERHVLCPNALPSESVYLVWVGDAAGTYLQVEKASGLPNSNAQP